jgi:hypothetical protein
MKHITNNIRSENETYTKYTFWKWNIQQTQNILSKNETSHFSQTQITDSEFWKSWNHTKLQI